MSLHRLFQRVVSAVGVSVVLLAANAAMAEMPPGGADSSALSESELKRRDLYQRGKQAVAERRWEEAEQLLDAAWSLRASYDVALVLAQAEFNLNKFRDAAEHLSYYMRHFPAKEAESTLWNGKNAFEIARKKIATVRVGVDRPGAQVLVDGSLIGTAPLDREVFLEPGSHRLEARLDGRLAEQSVDVAAGGEYSLDLAIGSDPLPGETPLVSIREPADGLRSSSLPAERESSNGPKMPILIAGGALALAGLSIGLAMEMSAQAEDDELAKLRGQLGPMGCAGAAASSAGCDSVVRAARRFDRARTAAVTGFVAGGVAAIGTLTYALWPRSKPAAASAKASAKTKARPSPFAIGGIADGERAELWLQTTF